MIQVTHPNIDEFEVIYLSEGESLNDIDPQFLRNLDPASKAFFQNKEEKMEELLRAIEPAPVRKWYENLLTRKCALAVLLNGKRNTLDSAGGSYLLFQNDKESFVNNSEWPHSGAALDAEAKMYNPKNYPAELLNIVKMACPHFSYWYGGAKLVKPGDDNLAKNDELLSEFIEQCENPELDMKSLRILYTDYSGSHLFYDGSGNIWCGGQEEGDFWKTKLNMRETLNSIFATHSAEEFPIISSIVDGQYL